jgi:hypothetical protein
MDDAASRRTSPATGQGLATTRIADRVFGLISAAAGTSGDTPRRIQLLRPSTTARRLTQFRTGYVSRTQDLVRAGLLAHGFTICSLCCSQNQPEAAGG